MTAPDLSSLSDADLIAFIGGYYDVADPAVLPDPAYLAQQRRLFVDLRDLYGAGNVCLSEGVGGDVLMQWPTMWRPVDAEAPRWA